MQFSTSPADENLTKRKTPKPPWSTSRFMVVEIVACQNKPPGHRKGVIYLQSIKTSRCSWNVHISASVQKHVSSPQRCFLAFPPSDTKSTIKNIWPRLSLKTSLICTNVSTPEVVSKKKSAHIKSWNIQGALREDIHRILMTACRTSS